jgi:hypothetical protein
MTEKKTHGTESAEQVAKTMWSAWMAESQRFIDEAQRANERAFIESERLLHEQQKMFDASMKMGRAMSSAMLENARRMSGIVGA